MYNNLSCFVFRLEVIPPLPPPPLYKPERQRTVSCYRNILLFTCHCFRKLFLIEISYIILISVSDWKNHLRCYMKLFHEKITKIVKGSCSLVLKIEKITKDVTWNCSLKKSLKSFQEVVPYWIQLHHPSCVSDWKITNFVTWNRS